MEKQRKILILIDGNALIHRSYHGLPPLTTKSGELVNAVYGFAMTLLSVIEKFHPEYIAASFDLSGPTFRHEKFAEYKGTRAKAPDDLYSQIPRVKELVKAFNIPIYELSGFEADDVIGTLSRQAVEKDEDVDVIIVTGDSDAFQLINDRVKVFTMRKGVKDTVLYDKDAVFAKYGLVPEQLKDFKGLRGDTSDNIPGVKGIGEKGAVNLLQQYASLEGVYEHVADIKGALKQKLEEHKESAFLSKELGTIDVHAPVDLDFSACVTHEFDRETIAALLKELSFFSLIKRLPGAPQDDNQQSANNNQQSSGNKRKNAYRILKTSAEAETFLEALPNDQDCVVLLDMQAGTLFGSAIQGICVLAKDACAFISFSLETRLPLKAFLENASVRKCVYGAKEIIKICHKEGIDIVGVDFDVMIAGYLLNAGGKVGLEELALSELGEDLSACDIAQRAQVIRKLKEEFATKMKDISQKQETEKTLESVFRDIEMPLITVLAAMEEQGIRLNGSVLQKLSQELSATLKTLEQEIYDLAGQTFNINSPKQLAKVLFEDLQISTVGVKKGKTGFSTASAELVKLRDEYEIVQKIENYRELFKLKTTYLDTLPRLVDTNSRIHTVYHQEIAATGRLSSKDPNLQNIPARNQWGTYIRGAFEAEKGFVLVGADYSQIELRVAAHLADDKVMIEAFRKKEDIHRTTASLIHQIKPEEVTDDMRRQAKVLNFGIMYGMGTFGLSQAAGVDQQEASKFIKGYFEKFSGMAKYLEGMKSFAREHGFVETELGRRRYIPEINSTNQQVARGAERMAINMPIQGLEADIVKLAMIAADKLIAERFPDTARMLLQVHDELIFEVKEEIADTFSQAVKETMETIYELKAPLVVDVFTGKNWGEI
ncbi:MAG: DNA polymerase I [Candidatus Moranbacteria bacterium]|nr:DNA polymerase I [Candidatus Moranbacteria bacterium]